MVRVTRRGGWLHLIAEDYDMIHFRRGPVDPRDFWYEAPARFTEATGGDLFIGRHGPPLLAGMGLQAIRVDYVVVDTLRAPRESFARIFEAWRGGYTESVARATRFSEDEVRAYFTAMIASIRDPSGYAVWHVPVFSGRVP